MLFRLGRRSRLRGGGDARYQQHRAHQQCKFLHRFSRLLCFAGGTTEPTAGKGLSNSGARRPSRRRRRVNSLIGKRCLRPRRRSVVSPRPTAPFGATAAPSGAPWIFSRRYCSVRRLRPSRRAARVDVAPGLLERPQDEAALEPVEVEALVRDVDRQPSRERPAAHPHRRRQVVESDDVAVREEQRPLDHRLELPHVAGPGVARRAPRAPRGRSRGSARARRASRGSARRAAGCRCAARAAAERDRDHVEPVEEVLAEAALRGPRARGRGWWPPPRARPPAPARCPPRAAPRAPGACAAASPAGRASARRPRRGRASSRGLLEEPDLARVGPGEGTLLVAEQLRLEDASRGARPR